MLHTLILCPFYNDEASLDLFIPALEKIGESLQQNHLSLLIVNDGTQTLRLQTKLPHSIVHLHRNMGHQRAIAIGLAHAHHSLSYDQILIMDCDGEDRPEDIPRLLGDPAADKKIVVAGRVSRQEGKKFRFFYWLYKLMFFVLTGKRISFGNFMLIPKTQVDRLVYYSEIWNHLAGAVLKSKIPFAVVKTHRGKRYRGDSKMSFTALLLHGLGAIGVFIEIIASRLLVFSIFMIVISMTAILVVLFIKFFTDKAIPGWATTAISSMLIVLLQSFLLSLFTIFLYLSLKGQQQLIPARHYVDYVHSVESSANE
jgi:polyisoprenyl-phosphate glycosyltransferase